MARRGAYRLDPFYPIVDSAAWVARLIGVGARLIQLRVKDRDEAAVARETREALAVCAKAGATLVVNDYWRVAIDEGAPWVHLGQGDLDGADVDAIRKAGVKLGVSTHDDAELDARAQARAGLYRARTHLSDDSQSHGLRAAGPGADRRMEAPRRRDPAGRDRRAHRRARETVPRRGRGHRLRRHRHHAQRPIRRRARANGSRRRGRRDARSFGSP